MEYLNTIHVTKGTLSKESSKTDYINKEHSNTDHSNTNHIDMEHIGIELEQAVEIILSNCKEIESTEEISVLQGNGRILAEDIYSHISNPPFDRSPLDGFALCSKDLEGASMTSPIKLVVIDRVYAGEYIDTELKQGQAIRIMTGAPIPKGADCVIRIEDVEEEENVLEYPTILVRKELKHHENYCFKGEDVEKGQLILSSGKKLSFIEQGILASVGIDKIKVYRKAKVAVFVTGNELIMPGDKLTPGKIYDSNLHLLYARLCELGVEPTIAKFLPDDANTTAKALKDSLLEVDFVITTGGVSVGDMDIFHEVITIMGAKRLFWKVKLKPGTPAMFSMYQDKPMFHLSGNPFAAATTFELLVRPYLSKVYHDSTLASCKRVAILNDDFKKRSKARRFLRAKVYNGFVTIPSLGKHSSGILSSMQDCNCLIDIPAGSNMLQKGSQVDILLL